MKKIKPLLLSALRIMLASLVGLVFLAFSYNEGVELGKQVGRCEIACHVSGGKFLSLLEQNECQCQSVGKIPWIYSVSVEKGGA